MIRSQLLLIPFVLQMFCMVVDEFCFHRRRTLPRWERLGHPADTLTVLLCWTIILSTRPAPVPITVYLCATLFSCFFVTKDEWVHARFCQPGEHLIHAFLFILHPLSFLAAGLMWQAVSARSTEGQSFGWISYQGFERTFFIVNTALTVLFGLYQLIFWNLIWRDTSKPRPPANSMMT